MCNSYRIAPKKGAERGLRAKVSEAAAKLGKPLVRKSDPGIVVLADERVEVMRWGFHRPFNPSINNARSDKLEAGMWVEAWKARRCVIPVSVFYEWGPGAGGRKQAHEFRDAGGDFLWAAGIWEECDGVGLCYSMITTAAAGVMIPVHHRMPALLGAGEMAGFLAGDGAWRFGAGPDDLAAIPCASPLAKPRDDGGQGSLF